MNTQLPIYEIYALRYATKVYNRRDTFLVTDMHDAPIPMDYFIWVIRGNGQLYLVDTGFNATTAVARKATFLRCPIRSLANLGIAPEQIEHVIITHMHFDHAGNLELLPNAHLHLQEREMHYATGHFMAHKLLRRPYAVEDVVNVVRSVYAERVHFHFGDDELAEGIQLLQIGGHSEGLQAVRVHTQRGWVVLASDASHYYETIYTQSPFPVIINIGAMLDGFAKLLRYCEGPDHLIPGHDPAVLLCFPIWGDPAHDIVALHEQPAEIKRDAYLHTS